MKKNVIQVLVFALAVGGWGFGLQPVSAEQSTAADQSGTGTSGTNMSQPTSTDSGASGYGTPASGSTAQSSLTATVQSVDKDQKQLQVRDAQGNSVSLDIPSSASIMNGSKKGSLSDIKTGDSVVVTYNDSGKVKKVVKQKSDMSSPGANSGAPTGASSMQ